MEEQRGHEKDKIPCLNTGDTGIRQTML
ncbi:BnaCnng74130D [Brassica napus]|uniref:BnaCnng74130D protein n=1 Tax=Brassica napus TaxID=3708 RepID=A0A078JVW5_BRANA|nr:BnaCnng74130D [Brassica napus]